MISLLEPVVPVRVLATQTISALSKYQLSKMVDDVKQVFSSVAEISTIKKAAVTDMFLDSSGETNVGIEIQWSGFNVIGSERTYNLSNYVVGDGRVISHHPSPMSKNVILRQTTNTGLKTACVMTSEKDKDAEYIMVMDKDGFMTTVDLKGADKHGKVYGEDEEFSCLEWSPDETTLVYVAEKKRPKPTSFFTPPKNGNEDGRGQEFIYRIDWGEQMTGKHQSVVCFLNVKTKEISCHELPHQLCPGQIVWTTDGTGVFGVALESQPFHRGVVFCQNRESKLFHMDLQGNFTVITEGCSNIRTPRVSPYGNKIAFLRSKVGASHAKCNQLCLLSWPSKQEEVVIDVVDRKKLIHEDRVFYGIYGFSGLARRCWLSDNERLVFSTISYADVIAYVVDTGDGTIVEMPHIGSHQVLDVYGDYVLINYSTIASPDQLLLGLVPEKGNEICIEFSKVTPVRTIANVSTTNYHDTTLVNDNPHPTAKYSDIPISLLYFGPVFNTKGDPKRPLICWPHGGPHSASCNSYSMAAAFFAALGYSIVFVNYRGSLGIGQDGVDSLLGNCGLTDVDDVHKATLQCLKRFSEVIDESQVFLFGGSHGGFLVTHLAAKYPDFYKAVVARNPVVDIPLMAAGTDIPDWAYVECGFSYEPGKVADGATLTKMFARSPVSQIDKIKIPVLLLVGKNDARVPPSQGLNFHRLLLARGIETELHLYDDSHPLSKVEAEVDSLIHTALWFEKCRGKVTD